MKRRILFVDDEPAILDGLKRMLRKFHPEWEMAFALSGKDALERFAEAPYDVIVTDMRMPGMDGAELLSEISRRYPETVRIVLSGYSDLDTVMRVVSTAHRYLSKPCDADTLKEVVEQAAVLRRTLRDERVRKVVSRMETVPSVPSVYARVVEALQAPRTSLQEIGEIISQDVGMTAKVLQLVNSAFFGLRREVANVSQAVGLLGLETLRALVLMVGIFKTFSKVRVPGLNLNGLQSHMLSVGRCAVDLAIFSKAPKHGMDQCYLAGLLHDVGKLVLAEAMPREMAEILKRSMDEDRPLWEVEREIIHTTHAETGAYLMGTWGLPDEVVSAIAFHHDPMKSRTIRPGPLLFTHVANALVHAQEAGGKEAMDEKRIDKSYLKELGLGAQLVDWHHRCEAVQGKEVSA